jgi:serine/threonine protein kinase
LGVVLFVLVCGYLPFDGQSFQELFQKIINGYYTIPDWVSSGITQTKRSLLLSVSFEYTLISICLFCDSLIHFHFSECRDLISRMLVVNPAQRATLDQVREHPWIRVNGQPVPKADVSPMNRPMMIGILHTHTQSHH